MGCAPVINATGVVAKLASEQATLSALQGVLTARLLASQDTQTRQNPSIAC